MDVKISGVFNYQGKEYRILKVLFPERILEELHLGTEGTAHYFASFELDSDERLLVTSLQSCAVEPEPSALESEEATSVCQNPLDLLPTPSDVNLIANRDASRPVKYDGAIHFCDGFLKDEAEQLGALDPSCVELYFEYVMELSFREGKISRVFNRSEFIAQERRNELWRLGKFPPEKKEESSEESALRMGAIRELAAQLGVKVKVTLHHDGEIYRLN